MSETNMEIQVAPVVISHLELVSGSTEMLKQVQHDNFENIFEKRAINADGNLMDDNNFEETEKSKDKANDLEDTNRDEKLSGETASEEAVEENPNEAKKEKLDTKDLMAELLRMLVIMIALIKLASKKELYSGADLDLPLVAPEGEGNEVLNKVLFGQSNADSWKKFVNEVGKIENVPYDTLVSLVLASHDRNKVDTVKLKKPEDKVNKLDSSKPVVNKDTRGSYTTRKVAPAPIKSA